MIQKLTVIFIAIMITTAPVSGEVKVNETVNIGSLYLQWYYFDVNNDNEVLVINIDVISGNDISFYVTDENNARKAINFEGFQHYGGRNNIVSGSYSVNLGPSGRYYVFLDNTDSFSSTTVDITVEIEEEITNNGVFLFFGIALILVFIGIITYVFKNTETNNTYPHTNPNTGNKERLSKNTIYCGSCGSKQSKNKFCQNCGSFL